MNNMNDFKHASQKASPDSTKHASPERADTYTAPAAPARAAADAPAAKQKRPRIIGGVILTVLALAAFIFAIYFCYLTLELIHFPPEVEEGEINLQGLALIITIPFTFICGILQLIFTLFGRRALRAAARAKRVSAIVLRLVLLLAMLTTLAGCAAIFLS